MPPSDVKSVIKKRVLTQWKEEWEATTIQEVKCKEVYESIQIKPLDLKLKRRDAKVINRLQIGHTRLTNRYLFEREDPEEIVRCVRCGEQYSVKHILVGCPHLATERARFYKSQSLKNLLTTREGAIAVIKFLHYKKIYYEI